MVTRLERLIGCLSHLAAYPHAVERVKVVHTHISIVFLAGDFAYKVKKPLDLGFLDFTTLEKRRHFCCEEVRLNSRLAPETYHGIVPIVLNEGELRVGGDGEVVEYAVKMSRLPDEATLDARIERNEANAELIQVLARRIAQFHASAETNAYIAEMGSWNVVADNCQENFTQTAAHVGATVHPRVFARVRELTEQALQHLRPLMERRALAEVPRDTHGDLRLKHVYLFPDRPPPSDLVILDCIEFNERFRYADPVADMAFLAMDLIYHDRRVIARAFSDAYFEAAKDHDGRALLPFYVAYRAVVRAKVEGFKFTEREVPEAERARALQIARAHWLLALATLESPAHKPCVVLIAGLPGTGKSTLARALEQEANFVVVRSDLVRKELADAVSDSGTAAEFGEGIYTREWNERTYSECLRRTEQLLFAGQRVIVDASFREERHRMQLMVAAKQWGVACLLVHCKAATDEVRRRLDRRTWFDDVHHKADASAPKDLRRTCEALFELRASDADWNIHSRMAAVWEPFGDDTGKQVHELPPVSDSREVLSAALAALSAEGLV